MRKSGGAFLLWLAGCALSAFLVLPSPAVASTFNSGTSNCAGCHGGTPPNLPSAGSSILFSSTVNYTESCNPAPCSLRTTILNNGNMGSSVTSQFTDAQLDAVRAYLLLNRTGAVSASNTSFGSTTQGFTSSQTVTVTISNYRSDSINYSFSLASTTNFAFVSGPPSGSCAAASSMTPTSCVVNLSIRFQPQSTGALSTTLRVATTSADASDPNPGVTVAGRSDFTLSGTGLTPTPAFSANPNPLAISARVGSPQAGTLTIGNPGGTANLVLSSFSFSRAEFTRTGGTCGIGAPGIAPNTTCTVFVTYAPSAAAAQNGSVTIGHNAPGGSSVVALNGTGTQSLINPTSSSLAFGNVQQGNSRLLTQVVANTGSTSLNFTAPLPNAAGALGGANPGDFAVTGCASAVPNGSTCTLNVTFTPGATSPRSATLTISSDAANGPLVVSLTGAGVVLPEPTVTGPASDFPDTVINQVSAQSRTITINNPRTNAITYTVAAIPNFSIDTESCPSHSVAGGGTCTLTVTFRPSPAGGESRRTGTYAFVFAGTGGNPAPDPINVAVAGNALLPLQQSATTINAAAVVGSPTTTSVVLTNRASTSIQLGTLSYSGAAASDYSLDATNTCTPGLTLAPSSSCTAVTRFNPPSAGTRNATLTITHNAAGSPQTVALLGTATPAPQGRIELSTTNVAFADTQLASTSSSTVTVRNSGNLALNFSAFTFGGANAGDFSRSGTCTVGTPVAIGADCTVIVTFGPSALGVRSATLSIASDASNGTAVLAISGTGVPIPAPQVTLTPAVLDFGTQTVGGLYPTRRVRLLNSGTADLAVASIVVSGAGFANASAACPAVIAAGAACDIDIAFAPTSSAAFAGTLTVTSNAAGSPHATALSGTGSAAAVPVLAYAPMVATLDFGSVSVGSLSAVQTVTILNQGPGGATLTLLNAIGPDAASFSVVGGTCSLSAPLFEGASCTVDVRFAPGSSGSKTASVQVASTGSFPPVLTLTGVGLAGPNPSFALSDTTVSFASTRVGSESLPATVRLASSGSGVVTVTAMEVTGPFTVASTTCPAMPFTLAAGTECAIVVSFKPNREGTTTGTLKITSDASPAVREIALSGSGEAQADVTDGGGGCTIGGTGAPLDPTLWLFVLGALAVLARRERQRRRPPVARRHHAEGSL